MKFSASNKKNLPSVQDAVRAAAAAGASFVIARFLGMPEAYWAVITTLVVMQSTLRATLGPSIEWIVATAVGALIGALEASYFRTNLVAFTFAILFAGLLSRVSGLQKTAYRYASVTLTIVVLVPHIEPALITALHRFVEVSVGIIVALAAVTLWPERESALPPRMRGAPVSGRARDDRRTTKVLSRERNISNEVVPINS